MEKRKYFWSFLFVENTKKAILLITENYGGPHYGYMDM